MSSTSASLYMTQVRFCRALAVVRSLPTESGGSFQPSIADRLKFYGLYKQTLAGDCMLMKPSSKHIVQYAKWKSWDRLRGTCPIEAQTMYIHALIDLLKQYLIQYPDSELTTSLNESLDYLEEDATEEENLVQWDTNEKEKEEYYLGQIEPEQFLSSPIYKEYPVTPELSPSYSIYTPMTRNHEEVATATSSLYISTPYYKKRTRSSSSSNKATLKTLQSEVAALCEEINHLRVKERHPLLLRWRLIWLFKSVAKHVFLNILILFLLFLVLWRRKSPIAYTIIAYTGPRTRDLLRYISQRVVFWKVTV